MTNLSQQLCEICGIEAKQFTKDFKTRENAACFGRKITGIPKFNRNKFDIGSYTDNQSIYQVHWKEFPDFTLPENFVKLLKIANDVLGGVHFATGYTRNKPNIFEEQALMHYLPIAKLNDAFKLAIRKMEWVYG